MDIDLDRDAYLKGRTTLAYLILTDIVTSSILDMGGVLDVDPHILANAVHDEILDAVVANVK